MVTIPCGSLFQYLIALSVKEISLPNISSKPPLAKGPLLFSCHFLSGRRNQSPPGYTSQAVIEGNELSAEPLFFQAKPPQLPQLLLKGLVLQSLPQLLCTPVAQCVSCGEATRTGHSI